MLICEHAEINKARNILSLSNLKQRIRQKYYDRQDRLLEKKSWESYEKRLKQEACEEGLAQGRAEGLSQGREQGIAEGRAEGSHSKAIETARTMLADGEPIDKIHKYTGLSTEEIKQL